MYICVYICIYIHINQDVCVHTHIYIYIYIYIYVTGPAARPPGPTEGRVSAPATAHAIIMFIMISCIVNTY